MRRRAIWGLAVGLGALALAFGMSLAPGGAAPSGSVAISRPARIPAAPMTRVSVTGCEELGVVSASLRPSYRTDSLGSFELSLQMSGGMHLNEDYPTLVSLHGSEGLALVDRELGRERARRLDDGLAFDVAFRPSRDGSHDVGITVDYALCTDDACYPSTCRFHVQLESVA